MRGQETATWQGQQIKVGIWQGQKVRLGFGWANRESESVTSFGAAQYVVRCPETTLWLHSKIWLDVGQCQDLLVSSGSRGWESWKRI